MFSPGDPQVLHRRERARAVVAVERHRRREFVVHCPFCRNPDSRVVDSGTADDGTAIRRRRQCPECDRRFTTVEQVTLAVVKRCGVTEPFSREKVIAGVRKACQGRGVGEDALAGLAQQVEERIRAAGSAEVPSNEVGLAILGPLRELDEVAYLRFASVYRGFDSLADFEAEITMLRAEPGETVFEQRGVEFPEFWSINASTIVTSKYFRGAVGTDAREWSLRQLVDRVVKTYRKAGDEYGYFATPDDAEIFEHELAWMLVHQVFSFNSPVWFNVGTPSPQQVSACFILAVDDSMTSILNWYREEGLIFKGGSGAGLNLSRIRSSKELLSSGGTASGPVSFMRG